MDKDEAFYKRLLATFRVEAAEHVAAVSGRLAELPKAGPERRAELTEAIFREVHSLKGAARTVDASGIEAVCAAVEGLFSVLKREGTGLTDETVELLQRALDLVLALTGEKQAKAGEGEVKAVASGLEAARRALEGGRDEAAGQPTARAGPKSPAPPYAEREADPSPETVRVEKARLDSVLLKAEGLVRTEQALGERAAQLKGIIASVHRLEKQWAALRAGARRAATKGGTGEKSARPADLLDSATDTVKAVRAGLSALSRRMEGDYRQMGGLVDSLLSDTKRISMTPFSTLFEIAGRTVRELASGQGKKVELSVSGGTVEVDRRILEEMKDPFIHLLRNAVDHGVEKPKERAARGMDGPGRIWVSASQADSGKVELVVSDDGPGIDTARVRASAEKLGIFSREEASEADEDRLKALVFRSGVSTSPLVTDISGRGLGLAIVQEKAERLGGTVFCQSSPGAGTSFRIVLPLTLASLRALVVRTCGRPFAVPAAYVRRAARIPAHDVGPVEGRQTVLIDGAALPLVRLADILELAGRQAEARPFVHVFVLAADDKVIAFEVDEVAGDTELLVKGLGRQLKRVRNVSGAALAGGGVPVIVLNVPDLVKSAVRGAEAARPAPAAPAGKAAHASVLVVEDSVTARTLLRNILEAAGYDVKTAVDGAEAYALLKTEPFDLVVSDLDMPRMNGFELTARIRSDRKLADLPVVLVTALDSAEDKERGIEAGANAYIVKSSFEQSNLLEAIRRLV